MYGARVSRCEYRETWVSMYRHQVKKNLVLQLWCGNTSGCVGRRWSRNGYNLSELVTLQGSWRQEVSSDGNSAAKIFSLELKEKTPHQYAEIINVYANEITSQENNENKRTKWPLMDTSCKHASRQHTSLGQTSKANHSATTKGWYMYAITPAPQHTHVVASL